MATEGATTQRRTQAERSATTREALLDATISCLVKDGYANTTTARVAERAGVSRGAHLHHFQTRAALVAAAVAHLAQRRKDELLAAADDLPAGPERVGEPEDTLRDQAVPAGLALEFVAEVRVGDRDLGSGPPGAVSHDSHDQPQQMNGDQQP